MYYFLTWIIDIYIIILLLRLLISPQEALFHPIYRLLYRLTDPVLLPFRSITRNHVYAIILAVLAVAVLRGAVYLLIKPMGFATAVGISLLQLFQLLFQAYMVIWFISILSQHAFQNAFVRISERAFLPLYLIIRRLRIPRQGFYVFVFLFLWLLYAFLSALIYSALFGSSADFYVLSLHGLGEGLKLVFALFYFPGFFSLVIIVGVFMSWVSPDPSNPIVQTIYGISEPLLTPFRRFVPPLGGLDLSPMLALLCFHFLSRLGLVIVDRLLKALQPTPFI